MALSPMMKYLRNFLPFLKALSVIILGARTGQSSIFIFPAKRKIISEEYPADRYHDVSTVQ